MIIAIVKIIKSGSIPLLQNVEARTAGKDVIEVLRRSVAQRTAKFKPDAETWRRRQLALPAEERSQQRDAADQK